MLVEALVLLQGLDHVPEFVHDVDRAGDDEDGAGALVGALEVWVARLERRPAGVQVDQVQHPCGCLVFQEGPSDFRHLGPSLLNGVHGVLLEDCAFLRCDLEGNQEAGSVDLDGEAERLCPDRSSMLMLSTNHAQLAKDVDDDLLAGGHVCPDAQSGSSQDHDQAHVLAALHCEGLPRHVAPAARRLDEGLDKLLIASAEQLHVRQHPAQVGALLQLLGLVERRLRAGKHQPLHRLLQPLLVQDQDHSDRRDDADHGAPGGAPADRRPSRKTVAVAKLEEVALTLLGRHAQPLLNDVQLSELDPCGVQNGLPRHVQVALPVGCKFRDQVEPASREEVHRHQRSDSSRNFVLQEVAHLVEPVPQACGYAREVVHEGHQHMSRNDHSLEPAGRTHLTGPRHPHAHEADIPDDGARPQAANGHHLLLFVPPGQLLDNGLALVDEDDALAVFTLFAEQVTFFQRDPFGLLGDEPHDLRWGTREDFCAPAHN
mmetsp:Transcript_392/g.1719  ORF Transcript_392/g.1719 Transcript_392/m.1719 type:complete len:487 (+) Transcript_392:2632-4092(+)